MKFILKLKKLLKSYYSKKALHEYGMTQEDIADFTETVMTQTDKTYEQQLYRVDC